MTVYLANPSTQHVVFHYREPENGLLASVAISPGAQEAIGHAWDTAQAGQVIAQIERFGGRDAAESHGRMGRFTGLLYRLDAVVSESEIKSGHAAEVDTRQRRSAAEATKAALSFDRAMNGGKRGRRPARITQVEVEQLRAPHERPAPDDVAFSVSVDPEGGGNIELPA